jgi:hypothetical protein
MSFETAANQFSVTISDSTGAVTADQSTQPLSESVSFTISKTVVVQFSLTVSKSTGAGALKNPHVTFGTCFVHDFPGATDSVYVDFF